MQGALKSESVRDSKLCGVSSQRRTVEVESDTSVHVYEYVHL
jgi:hypothetical protein